MSRATVQRQKKKTKTWTTPVVLGLILGVVGAMGVIELRPQLAISPKEELAPNQPFSCPFEVTNTGYLSLHVEDVVVIFHQVDTNYLDNAGFSKDWDNFELERGGSKTILAYFTNGTPVKADIVIGVDYKYFGVRGRWLFRFQGVHMATWQWAKQPIGDIKTAMEQRMDSALAKHNQSTAPEAN